MSSTHTINGGGPQGGLMGILEYLLQTNNNTDFIDPDDKFKFIDDLSILEIINLISQGLSSFNFKSHVALDSNIEHNQVLPESNFQSQAHLDKIADWTSTHLMKLNSEKSKFMVVNYTDNYQFNTRLRIDNNSLKQVKETRLLGVLVNDKLSWHANTDFLVKKAYKRMIILHNLFEFSFPITELVNIVNIFTFDQFWKPQL